MRFIIKSFILNLLLLAIVSCDGPLQYEHLQQRSLSRTLPGNSQYDRVLIICSLGYNNLSSALREDLSDVLDNLLPRENSRMAVLAFCHNTFNDKLAYDELNAPVLLRLHAEEGVAKADTLMLFPDKSISASAQTLKEALSYIQSHFPSKSYGLHFSSHGTGWLPAGYSDESNNVFWSESQTPFQPRIQWVGTQFVKEGTNYDIDIKDFAQALPFYLDYIIFDACLMGAAEVVWELKDKCHYIVASPTEIMEDGMVYTSLASHLLRGGQPDLKAICQEYYEFYNNHPSPDVRNKSASISLIDCTKFTQVTEAFADIVASHPQWQNTVSRNSVQKYYYNEHNLAFYHDLRDFASQMGASQGELAILDEALGDCVLYHAHTQKFLGRLLERCCGLSVYIPDSRYSVLNAYYQTLGWNIAVGLIQE